MKSLSTIEVTDSTLKSNWKIMIRKKIARTKTRNQKKGLILKKFFLYIKKNARNQIDNQYHHLWVLSEVQIEVWGVPIPHNRRFGVPASARMLHDLLFEGSGVRKKEMWVNTCVFHHCLSCYSSQIGQSSQPTCSLLRRADRQRDHVKGSWT